MTLNNVSHGMSHNIIPEVTDPTHTADLRLHRMEMRLDALAHDVEQLAASVSELRADVKQTATTLDYILASLTDLQNRPHTHVQFHYPWEKP